MKLSLIILPVMMLGCLSPQVSKPEPVLVQPKLDQISIISPPQIASDEDVVVIRTWGSDAAVDPNECVCQPLDPLCSCL